MVGSFGGGEEECACARPSAAEDGRSFCLCEGGIVEDLVVVELGDGFSEVFLCGGCVLNVVDVEVVSWVGVVEKCKCSLQSVV